MSESAALQVIANLLYAKTGQEVTESRRWRVPAALHGIFKELRIDSLEELARILQGTHSADLPGRIVDALLNNETYFFRDRNYFELLMQQILPAIAERRSATRRLRIWSAGCSTGQEPLSLAMLLLAEPERWRRWSIEIVATDVSAKAIRAAKAGAYSQFEIQRGISITEMLTHFAKHKTQWRAQDALRRMVRFQQANLLNGLPGEEPFDLVLCRNVLMYFAPEARERALARLHGALAPDGWLMLGAGETVLEQPRLLRAAGCGAGLYQPLLANERTGLGRLAAPV
ncbi:protein-glutamate O-methyltransferase CheR [Porphyrobacter sp. GA68]|uniref:CheR family methyltransferase n=1 Tax=Porphyrobacter sp. GA68 TaxID=2883480 RepID=UPI001D18EF61|nr:protein-glutamate O-methyltransferase CheR [Porphyrobacter sp. GA68]